MTAVVDASVLVASVVNEERAGLWATSVLAARSLAGPELILAEACNVLRRMELAGNISRLESTSSFRDLLQLEFLLFPFSPFANRVWALRGNLTSYDAWHVAVAEELDCPLFTLDAGLSRAAGPMCEIITPPPVIPEQVVHQAVVRSAGK
jgi:predicted nucleic acid-binding protein